MVTPDLLLSYWVLSWFLLYYIGWIRHSPKLIMSIELIYNILQILQFIMKGLKWKYITLFAIVILFMKIIPLWIVRKDRITSKDITFSAFFLFVYLCYISLVRNKNLFEVYCQVNHSILDEQSETPFFYIVNKFERYMK